VNTVSPKTFFFLTATDSLSGVKTILYSIDGAPWQFYTGSFSLNELQAGQHTISYKAIDNALNEEQASLLTVRLVVLDVKKDSSSEMAVLIGAWRHREHKRDEDHGDSRRNYTDAGRDHDAPVNKKDEKHHEDDQGDEQDKVCGKHAKDRLEAVLSSAGITYYAAEDDDDFKAALRSNRYSVYVLLACEEDSADGHELENELREAVNSGEGLIVIKPRHGEDDHLADVLGVRLLGQTTEKELTVNLLDSPISNEGALENVGRGVRAHLTSPAAQSFGSLLDKRELYPAIIFNQYEKGRTLLFTFDLLSAPDQARAAALLLNGLNFVRPLKKPFEAPGNRPVRIIAANSAEPVDIQVKETIPPDTTADSLVPLAPVIDNTMTWLAALPAHGQTSFAYRLDMQGTDDAYATMTEVRYNNLGEYRLYGTYSLTLNSGASSAELLTEITDVLNTLVPIQRNDAQRIAEAWKKLKGVNQEALTRKEIDRNIDKILEAIHEVRKLSFPTVELRAKLDELLRCWEQTWYSAKVSERKHTGLEGGDNGEQHN
jgi:hypothetical protein